MVIPPQRERDAQCRIQNTAMQERVRQIRAIERGCDTADVNGTSSQVCTKRSMVEERGLSLQSDHRARDADTNVGEATS